MAKLFMVDYAEIVFVMQDTEGDNYNKTLGVSCYVRYWIARQSSLALAKVLLPY